MIDDGIFTKASTSASSAAQTANTLTAESVAQMARTLAALPKPTQAEKVERARRRLAAMEAKLHVSM
mgnify:CR=1 FL=1